MEFTKEKMLEYLEEQKKYWDDALENHSYTEEEWQSNWARVDLLEDLIDWVRKQ